MIKKNSFLKSTSIFMVLTLVGKFLALFKDMLVAKSFGTTYMTDAYLIAMTIPTILYDVIGVAITTTFIPILSERFESSGRDEMIKLANNIMNIVLLISIAIFLFSEVFIEQIVGILVPNFSHKAYLLTVSLTKISLVNILLMSQINGLLAVLQVFGEFKSSAIISVVTNLILIIYVLFFSDSIGISGLVYSTIIAYILQLILQIMWLRKFGYKFTKYLNFNDKSIKKMLIMILPVIIGTGISELNVLVDKSLASSLVEGSITAYSFGTKVANLLHSIFGYSIVVVTYPMIAKLVKKRDKLNLVSYIQDKINFIFIIIVPLTVLVNIFSGEIITILFKSEVFSNDSVNKTSKILVIMSIGLLFMSIRDICNRLFYSFDDTKTPMKNSIIGMIINILLGIILVNYFDINGLALASSISIVISTILMVRDSNRWLGKENKIIFYPIFKQILLPTIAMVVFTIYIKKFLSNLNNIILIGIISCGIGLMIYTMMTLIFNKSIRVKIISKKYISVKNNVQ